MDIILPRLPSSCPPIAILPLVLLTRNWLQNMPHDSAHRRWQAEHRGDPRRATWCTASLSGIPSAPPVLFPASNVTWGSHTMRNSWGAMRTFNRNHLLPSFESEYGTRLEPLPLWMVYLLATIDRIDQSRSAPAQLRLLFVYGTAQLSEKVQF